LGKLYQKIYSQITLMGSATARIRGNVQVIVRKDHKMRLSFLPEQFVLSSEQLVLVDTKMVFRP